MDTNSIDFILTTARNSFASINASNFSNLFGINVELAAALFDSRPNGWDVPLFARNLLILLFHLRHSLSGRAACICFHLKKTQYWEVVQSMLEWLVETHNDCITFFGRQDELIDEFPRTFSVIDCTELEIYRYGPKNSNDPTGFRDMGYSGKKKRFTIKYQVIVGCVSGRILHVYGPEYGSIHDATIYQNSGLGQYFWQMDEYCLGDRGYQGCLNIISPHKHFHAAFSAQERLHNSNIGRYRHIVERVFASLKKWGILSIRYRGKYEGHYKVFMACCILLSKQ